MANVRAELTDIEKHRRQQVLGACERSRPGSRVGIDARLPQVIDMVTEELLEDGAFVSASYFNWVVDQRVYTLFVDSTGSGFEYAEPIPYAPPYQTRHLLAWYAAEVEKKEKKENKEEEEDNKDDGGVSEALPTSEGAVVVPNDLPRDFESDETVRAALWDIAFGGRNPDPGCKPWEWRVMLSEIQDFRAVFGLVRDLDGLSKKCSLALGGPPRGERYPIVLLFKYKGGTTSSAPDELFLGLAWDSELTRPKSGDFWFGAVKRAGETLFRFVNQWLQGVEPSLLNFVESSATYETLRESITFKLVDEWREKRRLVDEERALNAQQLATTEARIQAAQEAQRRVMWQRMPSSVSRWLKGKGPKDRGAKVVFLAQFIENCEPPIPPFPLITEEDRRRAIRSEAWALLGEEANDVYLSTTDMVTACSGLGDLVHGKDGWGAILDPMARYNVVQTFAFGVLGEDGDPNEDQSLTDIERQVLRDAIGTWRQWAVNASAGGEATTSTSVSGQEAIVQATASVNLEAS